MSQHLKFSIIIKELFIWKWIIKMLKIGNIKNLKKIIVNNLAYCEYAICL